jgi:hypothetical protein
VHRDHVLHHGDDDIIWTLAARADRVVRLAPPAACGGAR